jgi:integrase
LRYAFAHYVPVTMQATKLTALSPAALQAWVNGLSAKGLAPRTVAKALAEVRRCLSVAAEHGKIPRNPVEYVKPPRRAHVERKRLTHEEATAFLAAAKGDALYAFFVLALYTGARPAELLGLKWDDVADPQRVVGEPFVIGDQLVIQRSIVKGAAGTRVVADTKTGRVRTIPLGAFERAALKWHGARQAERQLRLGQTYTDQGYIFSSDSGAPLGARGIDQRHFKPLLTKAKLPSLRLYDMRHSCLSILADEGVGYKVIAERAGHASVQTTLDHYIHTRPESQRAATDVLNHRLAGGVKA